MTATDVALPLLLAGVVTALTWYGVARALPRSERLPARAATVASAFVLLVGPLVALVLLVVAAAAAGWLTGTGAVDLLTWFFLAMAVGLVDAVWLARTRAVPVLTDSEGVEIPETVLSALRTGSLVGGLLAAAGFVGLAVTELTTRPETVGRIARSVPQGPVVLVGFLVGAPIFCLAFGGLLALYLRVTVIKPE